MSEEIERQLERIADGLERLIGALSAGGGITLPAAGPNGRHPAFAGFACSWTVDGAGLPSYVITADGEIADKHERQGDVWYSVKDEQASGGYRRVLTIKAGETLPDAARFQLPDASTAAENGSPGHKAGTDTPDTAERPSGGPQAASGGPDATSEAPDPGNPFAMADELQLQRLHEAGRAVYGAGWEATGPAMVIAYSDGRTERSRELSDAEIRTLIADLHEQAQAQAKRRAAYAG